MKMLMLAGLMSLGQLVQGVASPASRSLNSSILSYYPSPAPNGDGVLVVPGGGYQAVSLDYEGAQAQAWLNERGYHVWVLNYTVASTAPAPIYPVPQNQAAEAVNQIRALDSVKKLGIWGFSAGGHLSATTVTNPDVERNLDFAILAYPVITMDPSFTHSGSRTNLIGENPSIELQSSLSGENRVTNSTPPVFLFHTANDAAVPVKNSLVFAEALAKHGRKFSILILPDGPHGIALALDDPARTWTAELERFLKNLV
ncbi:endo-1,4-beta-xylanase B [Periconia macrospinosa]|uniref:Endo-1,4-beta-xylanase B n=1 Tax=Periconia macrospinosa TaxID=97972 RepID=A0A2V1E9M1_9PLEO|nr:endo-1,4-beta-xylanase B [Periconia macrospinosa]